MTRRPGDRSATRRGLVLGGLAGLTGIAALGACTPQPTARTASGPDESSLGEHLESIGTDPVTDLAPPAPEGPGRMETSTGRYTLTGTHRTRTLDPALVGELRFSSDPPEQEVTAPDGEEYLFFSLEVEPHSWGPTRFARRPRFLVRVARPGGEIVLGADWATIAQHRMVRVLADPAPQDAVLEVHDHERVQRLSLVDGSLLDSEVAHVYDRHRLVGEDPREGSIRLRDQVVAQHETEDGESDTIVLSTALARTAPMTSRRGWAPDGEQLVGVRVAAAQYYSPAFSADRTAVPVDPAVSVLRLADGTERSPVDIEDAATAGDEAGFAADESLLWFSVPADLETAQFVLRVEPFPRRADLAELIDLGGGLTSDLTFEPGA